LGRALAAGLAQFTMREVYGPKGRNHKSVTHLDYSQFLQVRPAGPTGRRPNRSDLDRVTP